MQRIEIAPPGLLVSIRRCPYPPLCGGGPLGVAPTRPTQAE